MLLVLHENGLVGPSAGQPFVSSHQQRPTLSLVSESDDEAIFSYRTPAM